MRNELFRTCVFGGYRKEDVNAYIESLESEIIRLEAGQKNSPGSQQNNPAAERPELEDFIVLGGDGAEETEEPAPSAPRQEDAAVQAELRELRDKLEEERARCGQAVRELNIALYEKHTIADELEELRAAQQAFEKDREAVKEVLMNARVNAEVILTQARREARLLLEDTHRQISEQKREAMAQLMGQLSENCSGLQASKCFLKEQVKNIEGMERQIAEIRGRMQDVLAEPANEA